MFEVLTLNNLFLSPIVVWYYSIQVIAWKSIKMAANSQQKTWITTFGPRAALSHSEVHGGMVPVMRVTLMAATTEEQLRHLPMVSFGIDGKDHTTHLRQQQ